MGWTMGWGGGGNLGLLKCCWLGLVLLLLLLLYFALVRRNARDVGAGCFIVEVGLIGLASVVWYGASGGGKSV